MILSNPVLIRPIVRVTMMHRGQGVLWAFQSHQRSEHGYHDASLYSTSSAHAIGQWTSSTVASRPLSSYCTSSGTQHPWKIESVLGNLGTHQGSDHSFSILAYLQSPISMAQLGRGQPLVIRVTSTNLFAPPDPLSTLPPGFVDHPRSSSTWKMPKAPCDTCYQRISLARCWESPIRQPRTPTIAVLAMDKQEDEPPHAEVSYQGRVRSTSLSIVIPQATASPLTSHVTHRGDSVSFSR